MVWIIPRFPHFGPNSLRRRTGKSNSLNRESRIPARGRRREAHDTAANEADLGAFRASAGRILRRIGGCAGRVAGRACPDAGPDRRISGWVCRDAGSERRGPKAPSLLSPAGTRNPVRRAEFRTIRRPRRCWTPAGTRRDATASDARPWARAPRFGRAIRLSAQRPPRRIVTLTQFVMTAAAPVPRWRGRGRGFEGALNTP